MANIYYRPMGNIQRLKSGKPGGYCRLYFSPVEHVNSMPAVAPTTNTTHLSQKISLLPGKMWYEALIPDHNRGYIERQVSEAAGNYIEVTVSAVIPFESQSAHLLIDRIKLHRYILLVQSRNGMMRIVGSKESPAYFLHEFNIGSRSAAAQTGITFRCISEDKPLIYASRDLSPVSPYWTDPGEPVPDPSPNFPSS